MSPKPTAICCVSIAPLRAEPSDRAEMVSQLLLGESLEIVEVQDNWTKVICEWDRYEGWMDTKQYIKLDKVLDKSKDLTTAYELLMPAAGKNHFLQVPMGATLPQFDGMRFSIGKDKFNYTGQVLQDGQAASSDWITKIAKRYLQAPYLWGGRSAHGIDCSGLTQSVYKSAGIRLKRDTTQQVHQGELVDFLHQVQPGDLAFFENAKGVIAHVGIMSSQESVIHAHGWVREDRIDHFGIFREDTRRYSHRLRLIKRVL
jgi:gamma-D-glutamyl-L-lysine dipeptidyl-peptidase